MPSTLDLYLTVGDIDRAHRLADIANEYIESHQLRFLRAQQTTLAGDTARAFGHLDERKTDTRKRLNIYSEANKLTKDYPIAGDSGAELELGQPCRSTAQPSVRVGLDDIACSPSNFG